MEVRLLNHEKHNIVGWRICEEGVEREAEGKKVQKEGAVSSFLGFSWAREFVAFGRVFPSV